MFVNQVSKFLAEAAILLPAFLISLSCHEFAHAFVATRLGDNTPHRHGRVTLNPLAHVDFMGLFFLLFFKIGWAKPVIFNHRNFKYPKFYSILTALAGPFANFVIALLMFYATAYFHLLALPASISVSLIQIFEATAYVNIMLGVFNLLPIPPLDGSHILMVFLVEKAPHIAAAVYRYSFFFLLALFLHPSTRMFLMHLIIFAESLIKLLVF
jgi:Zn-dependent protease